MLRFFQRRLRCKHSCILWHEMGCIPKLNGGHLENQLGFGGFGMVQLTQQPRQAERRAAEAVHHRHNATLKTTPTIVPLDPPLRCESSFVLEESCLLHIYMACSIIFATGEQVIYHNLYKFLRASNITLKTQFWNPLFLANCSWGILIMSGEQPRLENYRMPNWPKMTGPLGSAKQENHV